MREVKGLNQISRQEPPSAPPLLTAPHPAAGRLPGAGAGAPQTSPPASAPLETVALEVTSPLQAANRAFLLCHAPSSPGWGTYRGVWRWHSPVSLSLLGHLSVKAHVLQRPHVYPTICSSSLLSADLWVSTPCSVKGFWYSAHCLQPNAGHDPQRQPIQLPCLFQ